MSIKITLPKEGNWKIEHFGEVIENEHEIMELIKNLVGGEVKENQEVIPNLFIVNKLKREIKR